MKRVLSILSLCVGLLAVIVSYSAYNNAVAFARDCSVDLSLSPGGPYIKGVEIWVSGSGDCTTIKWRINGSTKYEFGGVPSPTTGFWWRTDQDQYPTGEYEVCMLGRRSSNWDDGDEDCRNVTIQSGGPGANPDLDGCRVISFSVSPHSNHIDGDFSFTGVGECGPGPARAVKFRVASDTFYEIGGSSATAMWRPSYTGSPSACFIITRGDWHDNDDTAESCVEITITGSGSPGGNGVAETQPTAQPDNSGGGSNNGGSSNNGGNNNGGGSSQSGQCNSMSRLRVRDIAVVNTGSFARLRSDHSTDANQLTQVPRGTQLSIVSGPYCTGRYVWWQTQYGGHTGWMAEINGSNNRNLIRNGDAMSGGGSEQPEQPTQPSQPEQPSQPSNPGNNGSCDGANPVTIQVGERGRIANRNEPTRLWDEPQGDVDIESIGSGREFTVIGGPRCSWGHNGNLWWSQVQLDSGQSGWVSYGYSGQTPWVERHDEEQRAPFPWGKINAIPSCVLMLSSGVVGTPNLPQFVNCLIGLEYMTEDQAMEILNAAVDCGLVLGPNVVEFFATWASSGQLALAASTTIESESVANCVISYMSAWEELFTQD